MIQKVYDRFSRLDTIPVCDGRTDTTRQQRPRYMQRVMRVKSTNSTSNHSKTNPF